MASGMIPENGRKHAALGAMGTGEERYSFQPDSFAPWKQHYADAQTLWGSYGGSSKSSTRFVNMEQDSCGLEEDDEGSLDAVLLLGRHASGEGGEPPGSDEDGSLAQLIAKFDRSIAAIWSLGVPHAGRCGQLRGGCTSPWPTPAPAPAPPTLAREGPSLELSIIDSSLDANSEENSFIQCGTNITNSIWSDPSFFSSCSSQDNSGLDYLNEVNSLKSAVAAAAATDDGSKFKFELGLGVGRDECGVAEGLLTEAELAGRDPQCCGVSAVWERFGQAAAALEAEDGSRLRLGGALNHSREGSGFTEVTPGGGRPALPRPCHSPEPPAAAAAAAQEEEGEDLLTSARTHFRPIRQEGGGAGDRGNFACCYADGTTFVVSSSFTEVSFRRSASGMLYLQGDSALDSPVKYMEYRDKRSSSDAGGDVKNKFVPKFCIRQVEKCCQTEDTVCGPVAPPPRQQSSGVSCEEESRYMQQLASYLDDSDEEVFPAGRTVGVGAGVWGPWLHMFPCNNNCLLPIGDQPAVGLDCWSAGADPGEEAEACPECPECERAQLRVRLRAELSADGEQLLSALSCLQPLPQGPAPAPELCCVPAALEQTGRTLQ